MTFNPASAKSILGLLDKLPDRELVVELGSQRYTSGHVFKAESTPDFYLKNGFGRYLALDVNDTEYTRKTDLNEPVDLGTQAALVTNIGTSEHCFDQGQIFETVHNLTKINGIMFHHLPFAPWPNHGFYNYNPNLFEMLAVANGYDILMLEIGDREGEIVPLTREQITCERGQKELEKLAVSTPRRFVYAAFRKLKDESFKKPFQKRYMPDIKSDEILQRYV